jgi:hypothetical protein
MTSRLPQSSGRLRMQRLMQAMLTIALGACRDLSPGAGTESVPPEGTVQVVFHHEAKSLNTDTAMLIVSIVGDRARIGSYEGEVRFEPQAMQVLSIQQPPSGVDEIRVVNDVDRARGRIRFAGLATQSFTSTEAFRMVVRLAGNVNDLEMEGILGVVGTPAGAPLARSAIRRSQGIRDRATNHLIAR